MCKYVSNIIALCKNTKTFLCKKFFKCPSRRFGKKKFFDNIMWRLIYAHSQQTLPSIC